MIIIVKQDAKEERVRDLIQWIEAQNLRTHVSKGDYATIIGVIGDISKLDDDLITGLDIVEGVKHISEPFKSANRKFHPKDSIIEVGEQKLKVGHGNFALIAGPCSVESEEQIISVAKSVKAAGATMLRGGAFKPRTSPYDFQGLKADGIELLLEAKRETGLPIVTEIMNANHLPLFEDVDVIQVGARNMQNFDLLRQLGRIRKPILLKRGLSATIEEWLMSAEYILAEGNPNVILCERGIRTFETYTRNTVDLGAIPAVKKLSHLPVIVDPSHGTGKSWMVEPLARAAVAVGADGVMIEVHNDPKHALCDGAQSLTPEAFADVAEQVRQVQASSKVPLTTARRKRMIQFRMPISRK